MDTVRSKLDIILKLSMIHKNLGYKWGFYSAKHAWESSTAKK